MLVLYAVCCLPLLAHALTREQIAQFTGGCSSGCAAQSPCGEVTTEEYGEILRLVTNGIPNHPSQTCNGNSTKIQPKNKIIEFPNLTPERFEQFGPGDAKYCTPNIVGYAKNGIPFYSGNNTDCKNGNNPVERIVKDGVEDLWAFDTCAGHASLSGVYHYRCNPRCLYNGDEDEFLGVAMDGYPIYGPRVGALGGAIVTNAALDECHGGNWNDGIGYRYIVNNEYPYTVGCLRGELRDAVECGPDQGRGSLCLCSGGDYESGYGGAYGGSGHSRRYKRGGGRWRHWGDSSSEEVEAQVFRFTALPPPTAQLLPNGELSPVGQCLITDACTFEEASVHFGGRWVHRWDHDHGDHDGNRRNNSDRAGNGPDIDTIPVPPVPDNEVDYAIFRIQIMEPAMETVARTLAVQCDRWEAWIHWRNRNCQGRDSENCNNADNYLRHITDMQNALRQLQTECESLGAMVQRAGRSVSVPDEIGNLPDWCMSQVGDETEVPAPGSQGGDNDRRGEGNP